MRKTILVVGKGEKDYNHERLSFGEGDEVIVQGVSSEDQVSKLRGFDVDLVVLTVPIDPTVIINVLNPMVCVNDGDIINLS